MAADCLCAPFQSTRAARRDEVELPWRSVRPPVPVQRYRWPAGRWCCFCWRSGGDERFRWLGDGAACRKSTCKRTTTRCRASHVGVERRSGCRACAGRVIAGKRAGHGRAAARCDRLHIARDPSHGRQLSGSGAVGSSWHYAFTGLPWGGGVATIRAARTLAGEIRRRPPSMVAERDGSSVAAAM